jgi:hypothetical protein
VPVVLVAVLGKEFPGRQRDLMKCRLIEPPRLLTGWDYIAGTALLVVGQRAAIRQQTRLVASILVEVVSRLF